jgi:hypothetical protein
MVFKASFNNISVISSFHLETDNYYYTYPFYLHVYDGVLWWNRLIDWLIGV